MDLKGFDYSHVFDKSRKAADTLSKGVQFLLKKNKAELITGDAVALREERGHPEGREEDHGEEHRHRHRLAAADHPRLRVRREAGALLHGRAHAEEAAEEGRSSSARAPSAWSSRHVWNSFGVEVHLVEMMDRILPLEDAEAVQVLARAFQKRGIQMSTGTKAVSLQKSAAGVSVVLEDKAGTRKTLEADLILVVIGRTINTDGIGLEKVGIATEKGFIPVGDYNQTKVPGIYAVGDVVATPLLAHVAFKEAEIVVEHIAGKSPHPRLDPLSIPGATYCEPQVASFGLPEWKAKEKGIAVRQGELPLPRRGQVGGHRAVRGIREGHLRSRRPRRSSARTWSARTPPSSSTSCCWPARRSCCPRTSPP